jgi:hypothetical protein
MGRDGLPVKPLPLVGHSGCEMITNASPTVPCWLRVGPDHLVCHRPDRANRHPPAAPIRARFCPHRRLRRTVRGHPVRANSPGRGPTENPKVHQVRPAGRPDLGAGRRGTEPAPGGEERGAWIADLAFDLASDAEHARPFETLTFPWRCPACDGLIMDHGPSGGHPGGRRARTQGRLLAPRCARG